ncbi:farnesol dehydrogenase-like [Photinus pyralis]|uniref:farnesol dehydrogenase-like n=1 Tax=Photinus pyralis TaxID=7054 RepID=UPI00126732F5|nr:farnesol dehydrogenase-like [Photinus pyralis]XP_031354616.1 farnesol dehydrogenase-like [Photinus pyralis]XP_031354617.1 farnesol dehydrogenase-like [Photinus pyralis]XP_031354618.1 farnesol dehydrogenase-like [Photinus pyralis]
MEKWEGKLAIVTGTSSGIGRGIAIKLVEAGLRVVGIARRENLGRELELALAGEKGRFYHLTADITKEEDVLKAFEWVEENLGAVHILVNNAGTTRETTLVDGTTTSWKEVLDLNIMGLSMMTREAVKSMRANNITGEIIHIGSLGGCITSSPVKGLRMYCASKHAVRNLTEGLRAELLEVGSEIKVSCIHPGLVEDTEIGEYNAAVKGLFPLLEYVLKPEDIGDMVLFVLSRPPHVQIHDVLVRPIGEPL